jgi:hypothetical protein
MHVVVTDGIDLHSTQTAELDLEIVAWHVAFARSARLRKTTGKYSGFN